MIQRIGHTTESLFERKNIRKEHCTTELATIVQLQNLTVHCKEYLKKEQTKVHSDCGWAIVNVLQAILWRGKPIEKN